MYSITCSVGYMLVVLLSYVSTSDYLFNKPITVSSPYYFGYNQSNFILNLDVTLKNIPTSVTNVSVIRYTYQYNYYYYEQAPYKTTANVNVDKKTRQGDFIILEVLKYDQTWFDVGLYNRTGLCYYTSQIIEGRYKYKNYNVYYWDTLTQSKANYYGDNTKYDVSNGYCFAPDVCKMVVDLSKACEDQQVSTNNDLKCKKEKSQYFCTYIQDNMKDNSIVIYQASEDNTTIEPIHEFKARGPLYLYFNFELFDNNTFVKLEATSLQNYKTIMSFKISVTAEDISEANRDVKILNYTETTNYTFSCKQYKNKYSEVYVGVINTTDNKITVIHKTRIEIKMKYNGTMLCCMLYHVRESVTQEITIKRYVKNKTLLIYQSYESTTTNRPESDELTKLLSSGSNWWIFLIPIGIIIVLILIIYIIIKRYWYKLCTKSRPVTGTEELNDNVNTNQVLYAKLDFGRTRSNSPLGDKTANKTEESEYATIVGVLHPFGNGPA